jgi:hypothetical protein
MRTYPGNGGFPILSTYLGGTAVACGTSSTPLTPIAGATSAILNAAGAAAYFSIAGTVAAATSPGYIPSEGMNYIPPIDNFNYLTVIGAGTATVVYVRYFQDL